MINAVNSATVDIMADLEESVLLPQLACPEGPIGIAVGKSLERLNAPVIDAAYDRADLRANDRIVEIGLGNGGHIASVLKRASGLEFAGVDLSTTMIDTARSNHEALVKSGRVTLDVASVATLPFADDTFNKAVAINTVYFWPDLVAGLGEMRRVLRAKGVLVIVAITPGSATELPFAKYGFQVYGANTLTRACTSAGFRGVNVKRYQDPLIGPDAIERNFFIVRAQRD